MMRLATLGCLMFAGLVRSAQAAPIDPDADHVACGGTKDANEDAPRWIRIVRALSSGPAIESVCIEKRSTYLTETGWTIWQRVIYAPPAKRGTHATWARMVESKVRIDCT